MANYMHEIAVLYSDGAGNLATIGAGATITVDVNLKENSRAALILKVLYAALSGTTGVKVTEVQGIDTKSAAQDPTVHSANVIVDTTTPATQIGTVVSPSPGNPGALKWNVDLLTGTSFRRYTLQNLDVANPAQVIMYGDIN